jgi:hypothetical protein
MKSIRGARGFLDFFMEHIDHAPVPKKLTKRAMVRVLETELYAVADTIDEFKRRQRTLQCQYRYIKTGK